MLEPQRMDRVLIVGTKDVMEPTINALHDLNLLHLEDYLGEGEYFKIGKPLDTVTSLSEKLLKLRSIKSYLGTKAKAGAPEKRAKVLADIDKYLAELDAAVLGKTTERSALESELKELNRREEALKPYLALGLRPELLQGYEHVAAFIGTAPGDLEPAIRAITPDYEYFSAPHGRGQIVAAFVPKAVAASVSDALLKGGFAEIEPTRETGEPAAITRGIEERKAILKDRLGAIGQELQNLDREFDRFIVASEELLSIDTQKAEAPLRFATSDNTFIIEGWVPAPDYQRLRAGLAEATQGRVFVTQIEPEPAMYAGEVEATHAHVEHHEVNAPVKFDNPGFMTPAQAFIDMYSRPKYSEIDPTAFFFLLFPIFYGFILGDVGYGLLLLVAAVGLTYFFRRSPGMQALTLTLVLCSVSSIVFGFLFGEFLGYALKDYLPWLYPTHFTLGPIGPIAFPIERMVPGGFEEGHFAEGQAPYVFGMKDLLVLTCLIGVAQLTIGYLLGFRNELRMHGLKTALLHKFSWLFLLYGGVVLVWYVFPIMMTGSLGDINPGNPLFIVGLILALLGLILLLMGEGVIGIVELPNLMSNVLSYTRLLAVGLSSVGIAVALKIMVGMLWALGPVGWVFAIVVFLLGHTINLLLGIIAPGLHALRLHYVEFFTKFYKGGGRKYDPFGYMRKYTEE